MLAWLLVLAVAAVLVPLFVYVLLRRPDAGKGASRTD